MSIIQRILGKRTALVYVALFAMAIGVATFIENDFGTSSAQALVYQSLWFEVLLLLFAGSLIYNMIEQRMLQRKQYSVLIFHWSILVILLGSGITRMWGWEGMLHVREGEQNNVLVSRDSYFTFQVEQESQVYRSQTKVFPTSLGSTDLNQVYRSPLGEYRVKCLKTLVNPQAMLTKSGGKGALKVVFGGVGGRRELPLTPDQSLSFEGVQMDWLDSPGLEETAPVAIRSSPEGLQIQSIYPMVRRVMASGKIDTLAPGEWYPLVFRALHSTPLGQFVFAEYEPKGHFTWESEESKISSETTVALQLHVSKDNFSDTILVAGAQGFIGTPTVLQEGAVTISCALGSVEKQLPFFIALDDFQMTRYPGTDAAATFASEVRVVDPKNDHEFGYTIHMNHVLDYKGYRFFQSSYDQDEMGSYLSVNSDFYGTWITYLGYFLLTLGMIWALFARKTRFAMLQDRARKSSQKGILLVLGMFLGIHLQAQSTPVEGSIAPLVVGKDHADKVSTVFVQDFRGRMKPMHTLSREVLRKLSGREQLDDITADQFILSAALRPEQWYEVPLIYQGKSPILQDQLGSKEKLVSYHQCFDEQGQYKLRFLVENAQKKKPTEKNANDKAILALDERINIMNMLFGGQFFRWVPLEKDPNNTWVGPPHHGDQKSELAGQFYSAYFSALDHALAGGHYQKADFLMEQLIDYQRKTSSSILPSTHQAKAEIWMNSLLPFNKLAVVYGVLSLMFLALLFMDVFGFNTRVFVRLSPFLWIVSWVPFIVHTLALAVRWYISERAPWSNGYESLLYIAWTSTLSGLLFSRKEWGALAATNILASVVLLIAMLSYLSPEITPLVPVLKSYWLTIHVSLEAGSYGFLLLGAIIGILILLLYTLTTKANQPYVDEKIHRLAAIAELSITGGLYMLSIGTYLGGIWANESWGRYWGWDAKETWALVSILVYAFILHMRFIPKFNNPFAFSVGTLVGLASIIMTYFGVNYYLSGLHSYAAGDPIPIPTWVYVTSSLMVLLSVMAGVRRRARIR